MKIAVIKGNGIIAPHVMDGFISGFQQLNHDVTVIHVNSGFGQKQTRELIDFQPDFCVSYGFVGCIMDTDGQYLLRKMGLPLICLHYDNIFFSLSAQLSAEITEHEAFYHHFIWDRLILGIFESSGYKNAYPIMLATDPEIFKPIPELPVMESAIAFVGTIKDIANRSVSQDHRINDFVEDIIASKLRNIDVPVLKLCLAAFEEEKYSFIRNLFTVKPEVFWAQVYYPIHAKGSVVMRKHVLDSIGGVDIHIYGASPWSKPAVHFHNPVPYTELTRVYQSYPLNLNVSSLQLESSVNNRVFDGFASQAFVLSDYKEDMKLIFPDHWEFVSFRNLEEMAVKGDYYLTHPQERKEIVQDLYQEVIQKHTYKHRAEEIINCISSAIEEHSTNMMQDSQNIEKYKQKAEVCPVCGGTEFDPLYSILGHDNFLTEHYRCLDCCTVFMNPMPTEEYLDDFYNRTYYSKNHREKMGWDSKLDNINVAILNANENRMDLVENYLSASLRYPKGKLLDIGCSTGHFLNEAKLRYWDVKGIEISDQAAQVARTKYGLDITTGTISAGMFDEGYFDVVTAWDVIEHIPDPKDFITNVKYILKSGGLLVLNTPNISSTASYFEQEKWRHLDPPLHVVLYDHISMGVLLKMFGFEILKISSGKEYLGQMQVVAKKMI
ncbi:hypothetical protein PSTEL_24970 [Paenibacillus stellifer]|uniref:Spore protein YkvP/CgeB glycosyl transferase-like domain-containing protein n=1 Tax=Paenibacillus stellifer TaxID=169760 RepID=A0A089LWH8_9BACL|nr:methyltransferase domain-containing protein [Paenibacillus stellifer]AIQ65876.1 hypothetical protein PSTEL_24970 [Paenibacillus stellifer]